MPLLLHTDQADPELWRAVHDQPVTWPLQASVAPGIDDEPASLHGMPADRLAMAASRLPPPWITAATLR